MDWPGVVNFTRQEVACRHCGRGSMAASTMQKFQRARDYLNKPVYGSSWCRCIEWNRQSGGVSDSAHVFTENRQAHAGDVTLTPPPQRRPMTGNERYLLLKALLEAGFDRIGIHPMYLHADDDPDKPADVIWLYT